MKALETNLAERNTMMKVLQKRAFEKPGDVDNVLSIPIHDPISLNMHAKQVGAQNKGEGWEGRLCINNTFMGRPGQ